MQAEIRRSVLWGWKSGDDDLYWNILSIGCVVGVAVETWEYFTSELTSWLLMENWDHNWGGHCDGCRRFEMLLNDAGVPIK